MPRNNPAPNFALHAAFNARTWSNVNVFDRGSNNITLPTFATGEGIYEDAISFLNGRGKDSGFSVNDLFNTGAAFSSGDWTISIDSNDKVKFTCSSSSFKIRLSSGTDVLGVGSSSFGSATVIFTCPNDWTRGNAVNAGTYEIVNASDANNFNFTVNANMKAQDLVTCIRERGTTNDVDDVNATNCLEELDSTANSNQYLSWYVNDSDMLNVNITALLMILLGFQLHLEIVLDLVAMNHQQEQPLKPLRLIILYLVHYILQGHIRTITCKHRMLHNQDGRYQVDMFPTLLDHMCNPSLTLI